MWSYDTCILCHGKGKIQGRQICPVCEGEGLWEFVVDDNARAVQCLVNGETPENEHIREICDRRLAQVTPDNFYQMMALQGSGTESDFDALHDAGARKWGWAWAHANRFAIELARLCGGNPTEHRVALSRLAWKWLQEENQKKVDAPIDIPE